MYETPWGFEYGLGVLTNHKTLRFVQSLPKRQRQPLANKFKNADPLGMIFMFPVTYCN